MAAELFMFMTGVQMRHVPYRGSAPALIDLLSGQVQVMSDLMPASIGYIRADKLRALAVTATRSEKRALPNLPTIGEFVPGYEDQHLERSGRTQRHARRCDRQAQLGAINAGLADATIKARLADLGATGLPGTPAAFATLVAQDTQRWAEVVKFAHISAD